MILLFYSSPQSGSHNRTAFDLLFYRKVQSCKTFRENAKHYKVLHVFQELAGSGFGTTDGVHYNAGTYVKLYQYIRKHAKPWD